jgi:hypothetical protein
MSTIFDLTNSALDSALEINARCRMSVRGMKSPESDPDYLRTYCIVQFDPGPKTGKSTWASARASKEDDWYVIDANVARNRIQYFEALAKAAHARVVVIDCGSWLVRGYDPSMTHTCKLLADTEVKGRTIILLG